MFDSLADKIRQDEPQTTGQRLVRWSAIVIVSVLLFGALVVSVRVLGG